MKTSRFHTILGRSILLTILASALGLLAIGASTESPAGGGLFGGGGETEGGGALDLAAYDIEVVIKDNKFDELKAFGGVKLDKDGMVLTSDVLKYNPIEKTMTAEVHESPRVKIVSEDTTAVCGKAVYDMGRKVYDLMGGCVITEKDGTETSGESMSIVNDGGKMKAMASSTLDSTFGNAVDPQGRRTATSEKLENSVRDVQKTLNISEAEARAHVVGKNQPAVVKINADGKSSGSAGDAKGPSSGLINEKNWNRVPGAPSKGLETED